MPYIYKKTGDKYTVYKKETGEKVGSTAGDKESLKKYLGALHANANENLEETLRKQIRKAILNEVAVDEHAGLRLKQRLMSLRNYEVGFEVERGQYVSVGTYPIPDEVKNSIMIKIDILRAKNFPKNKDFGVKLDAVPINIQKINFYDGFNLQSIKGKNLVLIPGESESNGNIYFAIIRNNIMTTVMLMKNYITIDREKLRVDYVVTNWSTIMQNKIR